MRNRLLLPIVAFLLISLVAACSSADDPGTAQPTEGGDTATEPAGEDEGEEEGGDAASEELVDFIWVGPVLPETTDPAEAGVPPAVIGVEQMSHPVMFDVEGLEERGCKELPTVQDISGVLAESWEFLDDRHTLRMKFKEGVLSPEGNELTSEDVKWSVDRQIEVASTMVFFGQNIQLLAGPHHPSGDYTESPVEIVDKYTVDFKIADPGSMDLAAMTLYRFFIFDTKALEEHITDDDPWAEEFLASNSASFGAWQWTEEDWTPGEQLIMTRNPNYHAPEELGNIGRLIMRVIPEGSTRAQLVSTGEVDYAALLAPNDFQQVADSGTAHALSCVSPDRDMFLLNQADEKYADVRVRQAISMALDREELAQLGYHGFATPSTDGMPQAYDFDPPEDPDQRYRHDPERARELLEEAGYGDGFDMNMTMHPGRPGPQAEQLAVGIQSQLAEVGINVSLQVVASGTEFETAFIEGDYETMLYQAQPALPDPAYSAGLYGPCGGYRTTYGYCSERFDELQRLLQQSAPDDPKRREYTSEIAGHIVETVSEVYLVDTPLTRAFSQAIDISTYQHHPYSTTVQVHRLNKNVN